MAALLWPSDALAQRGGGSGRGGGGGGGGQPSSRGGGPGPNGGGNGGYRGGGPNGGYGGGHGGYPSGGYGYRGGYYRPGYGYGYGYRPYYYRPYYYSPYWYNGFYSSFYFGAGWYPFYAGVGWGYPYYGAYYGGYYGYPYAAYQYPAPYPYPAYAYTPWSSARIEVRPRDAQVYVDGTFAGVVDSFDGVFQRLDVPAGEHEITIYAPGYHSYSERTLFQPGQSYHFKTDLQPLPPGTPPEPKPQPHNPPPSTNAQDPNQPGYGNPPGYGNQPGYNDPNRPSDPYGQPPMRPPDQSPYGRTQPPPDRNRVEMGGGFATLSLRVQPEDAIVQIDGQRWDGTEGGSRLIVQLAAGQHRIDVRKDGFRPYSTTITIRAGEPQSLNIALPPQDGTVRGTSQQ
jgi:hypothetical protein